MSKKNLKLVKSAKDWVPDESVELTPAEQAEAARFRALTANRAKHQAAVTRLITKLRGQKQESNAA